MHTSFGKQFFKNFLNMAGCKPNWKPSKLVKSKVEELKQTIGKEIAISAISGGVDSCVSTVLVSKAIGKNLQSFIVDTGLMRYKEVEDILPSLKKLGVRPKVINASNLFFKTAKDFT